MENEDLNQAEKADETTAPEADNNTQEELVETAPEQPSDKPDGTEPAEEDKTPPLSGEELISKVIDDLGIQTENSGKQDDNKPEDKTKVENKEPENQQKPNTKEKPVDEETEILSSVKTERGRERLQRMLNERKEALSDLDDFKNHIKESGLDSEGFSNLMTLVRLVNSPNQEQRKQGLKAIEIVRADLYKSLGIEAPGVDLLDGFDDLKAKVKDMEMSKEDAIVVAQARAMKQQQEAQQKQQATIAQRQQEFQQYGTQAMQVFAQRAGDPNFENKVALITKYFQDPAKLNSFVRNTSPENWGSALLWMYDALGTTQPASKSPDQTPITQNRARPMGARNTDTRKDSPSGIEELIDSMGL